MTGSAPFHNQPLVKARELAFGIDLSSLIFKSQTHIDEIYLSGADMQVRINEKGEANYNVYKSESPKKNAASEDSSGAAIKLEKIELNDSRLLYEDASLGMLIHAKQLDYSGSGNLDQALFDLNSHISTDSLDFAFGGDTLLRNKRIDADLITRINTHTLTFLFRENKLRINRLPLQFTGSLVFRNDGYGLDFDVSSKEARLYDLITALPPAFTPWLEATRVKGAADFRFRLKGDYIASREILPSVFFDLQVHDGLIQHRDAPAAIEQLQLNFSAALPKGNTDSLLVKIEPLHFELAGGSMDLNAQIQNLYQPAIQARIQSKLNLGLLDQAAGFPQLDMKGDAFLNFNTSGIFSTVSVTRNRKPVTEITSVPSFQGELTVENGWLKFNGLPEAVSDIQLKLRAGLKDADYRHITTELSRFSAQFGKGRMQGHAKVSGLEHPELDAAMNIQMNLADLNKSLPLKTVQLAGDLNADIKASGTWNPAQHQLPVVDTRISWKGGSIHTSYYPEPIQQIDLKASAKGLAGDLKSMQLELQPVRFQFEKQPFNLSMLLDNFEDIGYRIEAKGTLDLGRIYRVFAIKGMDFSGLMKADLSLKGRQSDAKAGRYQKLQNQGSLQLDHFSASTPYFPKPFLIESGTLRFNQDKVWMNDFSARYGASDFQVNGSMSQFLDYLLTGGVIKGHFDIRSGLIDADEFMYHAPADSMNAMLPQSADSTATGVIVFPPQWDFSGTLQANRLKINGIQLDQAHAAAALKEGEFRFKETGFKLAGARVTMDGAYRGLNPDKGWFQYHLRADSFDVQRAYKEIQLFREMAASAARVYGMIGLDYALEGDLNQQMFPVLPSLKGGGELQLQHVKVKGLRLLGEVSRKTGRDSLRNPDLSKVTIKSRLANSILTIDRFKIKVFGFRLRCEGQTSLDGRLKLKMRLGLPPLGIFGIPMNVTGTQDNPRVRLGRRSADSLQAEPASNE